MANEQSNKENYFISSLHDNKVWGLMFNFDAANVSIVPNIIMDIDYEKGSHYSSSDNKIVFSVCPARLVFKGVSNFKINLSSGIEEPNYYKADCLYLYDIACKKIELDRYYYKIKFCDDVGNIEIYANDVVLIIDNENEQQVEGNCYIPITLRNNR